MGKKRRRKRQRQLDMAVAAIHRRHGPRALVKGKPASAVPHIPTGFPALDRALGIGGLPRGRVCELVGPATSGKTTLALKFLAQAQAGDGQCVARQHVGGQRVAGPHVARQHVGGQRVAYVDQALYFDPDYAHRCGLDLSRLLVGTAHDLQEALAMTEALARNGDLAALVFDALSFLWTDPVAASLLAATLNRLPAFLARSGTTLLVLHDSPLGNSPTSDTPTDSTSALSTLAHTAAVRLQVIRERWLRQHGDIRGYEARVEVLKNRHGPAGRQATIAIKFNGIVRGNGL